jgi:hypothetical protein
MTLLERCCCITRRPGSGNPHFEGLMDELVIYNRDLTDGGVAGIHQELGPGLSAWQ